MINESLDSVPVDKNIVWNSVNLNQANNHGNGQ